MKYIGISENRLRHSIGVARKAYNLSKEMGYAEEFARRMFMLGYIHDIGYEFSTKQEEHPAKSAELLSLLAGGINNPITDNEVNAIREHGQYPVHNTLEYKILNMADMLVNSKGEEVSVSQRLEDIKERYGEHSDQYLTACDICYFIGLTPINLSGNKS